MGGFLVRTALRRTLGQVRHVTPVRPRAARGLVAAVYRQVERDFGLLAPPIALHSPAPAALAASWLMLRETLVASGHADRARREAVAAAVSAANACPYCVEVHRAAVLGFGGEADPDDPVAAWAADVPDGAGEPGRRGLPFPAEQAPELIGVAATFHYLNRMVNVFLGESPLPPGMPAGARGTAQRMLGRFMRPDGRAVRTPGASLDLLPAAPLPADLAWAAGSPSVASAFARAAAAVEAGGRRSVPQPVRELVAAELAGWDGRHRGPSRGWVEVLVDALDGEDRAAGRLALLTALASYQVDPATVGAFLATGADHRAVVELTSWASLTAARRVITWRWAGQPYTVSAEDRSG